MTIEKCQRCLGNQAYKSQIVAECLPVSAFGDVLHKSVEAATIGLNPALDEFYHKDYTKLKDRNQRLAVLKDYEITSRSDLQQDNVEEAQKRRKKYFTATARECHPFFKRLQNRISDINPSWSFVSGRIIHIDLVACATREKWGKLGNCRKELLNNCQENFLATLSELPSGTVLIPTNQWVSAEIQKLNIIMSPENENIRCIGKLKLGDKEFPVARSL
jgi:hypothetical protein